MTRLVVSQSNYVPWKGFFDLIRSADLFVVLDSVQFTKNDWRNRNRIKTAYGLRWLTIPIQQRNALSKAIDEIEIAQPWSERHWRLVESSYQAAPAFDELQNELRPLYRAAAGLRHLSEINRIFLEAIARRLGITTPFLDMRALIDHHDRTLRLVELCRELGADTYLTGPTARGYLDEKAFAAAGVAVEYAEYSGYPVYPQLHGPFEHQVSIIDLLAHVGFDGARGYMRLVSPVSEPLRQVR